MFAVGWGANQFAPLLLVYRRHAHLSETAVTAMFGVYALGLIPSLLVAGPLSDRHGRRSVLRPVIVLSGVASLILVSGSLRPDLLYVGRFLAGVASGCAFSAGTAWVKELSEPNGDGARRATVALSAGFGGGPLVAGAVGQWLPDPEVVPYLAHLGLVALIVPLVWHVPDDARGRARSGAAPASSRWSLAAITHPGFTLAVLPWAPWVFATATIAFATLPSLVAARLHGLALVFNGAMTGLTLLSGILVQPVARRLGRARTTVAITVGLLVASAGLALAAITAAAREPALVPLAAIALGASYGMLFVSGLRQVERFAAAHELATMVAIFYAAIYVGFAAPYVLAALGPHLGYAHCLLAGCAITLVSIVPVLAAGRRPATATASGSGQQ